MTMKTLAAAGLVFVSTAFGASAATFDFLKMADDYKSGNGGKEGSYSQLLAFDPSDFTDGGVTITSITAGAGQHPFFDGGKAGLGVCSNGFDGSLSECSSNGGSHTGDDNMTFGETLTITFNKVVKLVGLDVLNHAHNPIVSVASAISIDDGGGAATYGTDAGSSVILTGLGASSVFTFTALKDGPEIYLSLATVEPVPLPAGALLLISGMGGLAALRRRRKA